MCFSISLNFYRVLRLYQEKEQYESEVAEMKSNLNELSTELRIMIR